MNLEEIGAAAVGNEDLYELDPSIFFPEQKSLHTTEGTELYNVQDVEKTKALMIEAGYDGTPIRLLTTKDYPEFYKAAVVIASQLEDVGFTVDIQVADWATVVERRQDVEAYEIFTTSSSFSSDPTSQAWMIPGAWPGSYESPAMEKLIKQWALASDPDVEQDLLAEMNRVVYTEVPEIKGSVMSALYVGGNDLEGYPNWMDTTFWNAWLSGSQ